MYYLEDSGLHWVFASWISFYSLLSSLNALNGAVTI
jgi:hypothetical protein